MKILLLLDVAPDYRELFLRKLGQKCDLTVLAHSCEKDNLTPPNKRGEYKYHELTNDFGHRLRFNFELNKYIKEVKPDIICVNLNFRYPIRLVHFFYYKWLKNYHWIWWGPFFGQFSYLNPIKRLMGRLSDGNLVYTQSIAQNLLNSNTKSFNNSQHLASSFKKFDNTINDKLHCLFVGRPQERKHLSRLFDIANRRDDILFRLVGPKMNNYFSNINIPESVHLYPGAYGKELTKHFKWSNLVVNPGHVGLLVMNAATHNRPIVIDSTSKHAPEVTLAEQTDQFFVDFQNQKEIDNLFDSLLKNPDLLREKGGKLNDIAKSKYTIEHMVNTHIDMFKSILSKQNS